MLSDIEISRQSPRLPIAEVAAQLGIAAAHLHPHGHYKGKLDLALLHHAPAREPGKLVLVSAITPTPLGEGKTVTTIGLSMGLNHIGQPSIATIRQPSLGPVFGVKGGAAGGGMAQVVPMEEMNLHLTGDFHAVTAATTPMGSRTTIVVPYTPSRKSRQVNLSAAPAKYWNDAIAAPYCIMSTMLAG